MKEELQNFEKILENNINKDLSVITSIVYEYDINKIIEGLNTLSDTKQEKVLELCINNYLNKIKNSSLNQDLMKKIEKDIDHIVEFYEVQGFEEITEEAWEVTYDLILKVIGHNSRKIELPINIDYIKSFCIHSIIKEEKTKHTILFIILDLASVCYCLENNNYDENDN